MAGNLISLMHRTVMVGGAARVVPGAWFDARRAYLMMLPVALLLHLMVFFLWWVSDSAVQGKPALRVLNLKLGAGGEIFLNRSTSQPQAMASEPDASLSAVPQPLEAKPLPPATEVVSSADMGAAGVDSMAARDDAVAPVPAPKAEAGGVTDAVAFSGTQVAVEAPRKSAVPVVGKLGTETGSASGELVRGNGGTGRNAHDARQDAMVMARYEQQLSAWVQKQKQYPRYAREHDITGNVVVRVRIDRSGRVVFSKLEVESGSPVLDRAALDMMVRADPVPAIPADYPAGEQFEFLIPVNFR